MPDLQTEIEAQRVALISDIETATRKGAEASQTIARLGTEPNLERLHVAVVLDQDGASEDLAKAEEALAKWRYDYAQATITTQAALTARRQAEAHLNELYGHHAEYFAGFAEEKTQAAHDAFLAVEQHYEHAQRLWNAAQRSWSPIHVGLLAVAKPGIGHVQVVPELGPENFGLVRSGLVSARPKGVEIHGPSRSSRANHSLLPRSLKGSGAKTHRPGPPGPPACGGSRRAVS